MKRRWRDLSRGERRAALMTAAAVPAVHVLLRIVGYRRLRESGERLAASWPFRLAALTDPTEAVERYRLALARTRVYSPLPGNCLSRSLTLWFQLKRHGLEPDLRLGVSMAEGLFSAHAWVEWRDLVLNDAPDVAERYQPLVSSKEPD